MITTRYIIKDGEYYQTPRRPTKVQYESRSGWSESFDDARVFQTKRAATRSKLGGEVVEVNVTIAL